MRSIVVCTLVLLFAACGPSSRDNCTGASCTGGSCSPGDSRACYTGTGGTENVGPCHGGMQSCTSAGQWGDCQGEVVPAPEICTDGIDNNCNGMVDENVDADGDGFTTCQGDCCDSTECANPAEVNPGAYDTPGDGVDNDCDGIVDNPPALCDSGLASNSSTAMDYAKAIDLCQTVSLTDRKWGVIDAKFTFADGTGVPDAKQRSIRPHYGTGTLPQLGTSLMELSTGVAAAKMETNPNYIDLESSYQPGTHSNYPADFVAQHSGKLPNAPGCPDPLLPGAFDPIMLTLTIRVPTNAHSFSIKSNFFSSEFPEYTCSMYNDFFVMLLDSTYTGMPANPVDKNLAFYQSPSMQIYPVGVNLASGDTGLFTQCVKGATGCAGGVSGTITTCTSTAELAGTGLDTPEPGNCDNNALEGGGTGWLTTSGNVTPGEIMKLRIAIWDTSDEMLDSLAAIDAFTWSTDTSQPGTVILRADQPNNPHAVDTTKPFSLVSPL